MCVDVCECAPECSHQQPFSPPSSCTQGIALTAVDLTVQRPLSPSSARSTPTSNPSISVAPARAAQRATRASKWTRFTAHAAAVPSLCCEVPVRVGVEGASRNQRGGKKMEHSCRAALFGEMEEMWL